MKKIIFRMACIAIIALSFVAFLGKSYETSLRGIDSNIHARLALDVTSQGFTPRLPIPDPNTNSRPKGPYLNDHPFFIFWINGWIMRALGPSAWSARLLTAAFSTGCVVLTLALGALWHSELFGVVAALLFLFTRDIILTGATMSLDPVMMFFILLTFLLWQREKWIFLGITAGIGLWTKTPVVLLVFPTAILVEQLKGRLKTILPQILIASVLALAIGSWVWIITGVLGGWNLVQDYWVRQLWGTVAHGRNISQSINWWMFFRLIKNGFIPGLPFLLVGIIQIIRNKLYREPAVLISTAAIAVVFLALLPMKFRMDYYYNPIFPFLAIISAYSITDILKPFEIQLYSGITAFALIFMAILVCSPISLGPESFVALKRFMPFIQSYGKCDDIVALIPGGEPIGSTLDYRLVLNFYTARPVQILECRSAKTTVQKERPQWMILSRENYQQCLTQNERNLYPSHLIFGNQYLLSRVMPTGQETTLTPLERELKPVVDCNPQPYPNDIYHKYD